MTLDATTGLGTTIGGDNSGIFGMSMDFDASDTLFALEQLVSGGGNFGTGGARNLVTIDTSTGLATVIGATTGGMDALAFRNDRVLSPQEFTEHLIDVIEDLVADSSLNRFPARNFLRILDQVLFRLDRGRLPCRLLSRFIDLAELSLRNEQVPVADGQRIVDLGWHLSDVSGCPSGEVVIPNRFTWIEAPSRNAWPLSPPFDQRYQQVYAASEFGIYWPKGDSRDCFST